MGSKFDGNIPRATEEIGHGGGAEIPEAEQLCDGIICGLDSGISICQDCKRRECLGCPHACKCDEETAEEYVAAVDKAAEVFALNYQGHDLYRRVAKVAFKVGTLWRDRRNTK